MDFLEGYIICPNKVKMDILEKLNHDNNFFNYSFMTLEDLKRRLTFKVKQNAVLKLSDHYNIKPEIADAYINALLMLNESYDSKKGLFLKEIYDFLLNSNLIETDIIFINSIKNHNFTFVGYDDSLELKYVISLLTDAKVDVIYPFATLNLLHLSCHYFPIIEDEVAYVFRQIIKLIQKGINLNDIKICNLDSDYNFVIKKYLEAYKIPLELPQNKEIESTNIYHDFINHIKDGKKYQEIVELLKSNDNTILNKLIEVINAYKLYDNDPKDDLKYWPYLAKKISFDSSKYDNTIELIDMDELDFNKNKYVFLLNFNLDACKVIKDERFILDEEAQALGLDTTKSINEWTKAKLCASLNQNPNITITYSSMHSFKANNPSPLIDELNIEKIKHNDYEVGYNKVIDDLYMAKKLDDYIKYNEKNEILFKYYYDGLGYNSYDNKYKGLNKEVFHNKIRKPFTLSYTDIHNYFQCPFKYYCQKILRIDTFTPTLDAMLGSFAHAILEDFENENDSFDFEVSSKLRFEDEKNKALEERLYEFSAKDIFYFNKMKEHIKLVIEEIKAHKNHTSLNNTLCEKKMDVSLYDGNLIFKGFIDKLWYSSDKSYVAIIDYKTGKDKESLDNLIYGENLQLPVYIYLLKNDSEFKHANLVGFYLQKINIVLPKKGDGSLEEQIQKNLRLEGYTHPDYVDYIDNNRGEYLKNYKENKDTSFSKSSKIFNDKDVEDLFELVSKKVDEAYNGIMNANFDITAKRIDGVNISCEYCPFVDCCYKTDKDIVELKGKKWKEEDENANEWHAVSCGIWWVW